MKYPPPLAALLVTVLGAVASNSAHAVDVISGRASVVDGDTIDIRGKRIRLQGVDAPESWQNCEDGNGRAYRCGKEAAFALDRFLLHPALAAARSLGGIGRSVS